jgi:hypothetical protein
VLPGNLTIVHGGGVLRQRFIDHGAIRPGNLIQITHEIFFLQFDETNHLGVHRFGHMGIHRLFELLEHHIKGFGEPHTHQAFIIALHLHLIAANKTDNAGNDTIGMFVEKPVNGGFQVAFEVIDGTIQGIFQGQLHALQSAALLMDAVDPFPRATGVTGQQITVEIDPVANAGGNDFQPLQMVFQQQGGSFTVYFLFQKLLETAVLCRCKIDHRRLPAPMAKRSRSR